MVVESPRTLDWQGQLRNKITTPEQLAEYIDLTQDEMAEIRKVTKLYPMSITPYYASLMDRQDRNCPIRRMAVPNGLELVMGANLPNLEKEKEFAKTIDPEKKFEGESSLVGLRQEFDGKATILTTMLCQSYCRYCFRKYWLGHTNDTLNDERMDKAIDVIAKDASIKEVCISGGDPLVLPDRYIKKMLSKLKEIDHVEVMRMYSRTPVTMPQRITDGLIDALKEHPTLYFCTHFNHPKELTPEAVGACRKIVNNGIPVLNQAVLLKGVNDNSETMKELFWGLVKNKVKPLYLQHCIKQTGSDHLVTDISVGTDIIRELYGHMSAIAIPLYDVILYGGKALMMPNYVTRDASGREFVTNNKGELTYLKDLEQKK